MPRMSISQKQQRVAVFLLGALRNDNLRQLGESGFDLADWEQGLSLLKQSAALSMRPAVQASPNVALASLEAFERRWVPIAQATLEARFPELFERVFAGYRRESGPALVVTMSVLADRLAAVAASDRPDDRAAMELLARRGLTGEVLAEMQATLARALAAPAVEAAPSGSAPSADERDAAEQRMWRWYLEWSRIARTAIADRTALRRLGFLRRARGDAQHPAPPAQLVVALKQVPALPPSPASTPAP